MPSLLIFLKALSGRPPLQPSSRPSHCTRYSSENWVRLLPEIWNAPSTAPTAEKAQHEPQLRICSHKAIQTKERLHSHSLGKASAHGHSTHGQGDPLYTYPPWFFTGVTAPLLTQSTLPAVVTGRTTTFLSLYSGQGADRCVALKSSHVISENSLCPRE